MKREAKKTIKWCSQHKFWVFFFAYHLILLFSTGWDINRWSNCLPISLGTYIFTSFLVVISLMFAPEKGVYKFYMEKESSRKESLTEELVFALWKPIWILSFIFYHLNYF